MKLYVVYLDTLKQTLGLRIEIEQAMTVSFDNPSPGAMWAQFYDVKKLNLIKCN
jgi:hypothetical protein